MGDSYRGGRRKEKVIGGDFCLCVWTLCSVLACLPQFGRLSGYVEPSGCRHTDSLLSPPPHRLFPSPFITMLGGEHDHFDELLGGGGSVRSVEEFPRL
jgi:hypothetical protein